MKSGAWRNCTVETFYSDGDGSDETPCEVTIRDDEIVLSYHDDNHGWITYAGKEMGAGHYNLTAPSIRGRATLHRFEMAKYLDGYWIEQGYSGMWRVTLENDA